MREGDLLGRRVLDVGCGTGRWSAALRDRGSRVWGIDASPAMAEQARRRGVDVKVARAEALPFKDGWFDRALLVLVIHVLERPRAFAELGRVLAADARIVVATFDSHQFDDGYLAPYFPSLAGVDRARFPSVAELGAELEGAGFEPRWLRLTQTATYGRASTIERVRGRFISTLQLLPEGEFEEGLARLERELPEQVEARQHWLVGVAVRRAP